MSATTSTTDSSSNGHQDDAHFSNPSKPSIPVPILKTKGINENKPRHAKIVWDEDNLEYNEVHKTPKMKIDEPKTPYHYYAESSDDNEEEDPVRMMSRSPRSPEKPTVLISESAFTNAIAQAAKFQEQHPDHEEDYFERNEATPGEFAKKRKQHYDEFKQVAKMREMMRNKALDDEDDDDGEREEHGDDTHKQ